jgi:citrate lyase subunit beta/citryl-CoA lyase
MQLPYLRSLLFTPASDARKLEKALASAADGVVCDLEDAVAPADKESARGVGDRAGRGARARPGSCVNAAGTAWFEDDLAPDGHGAGGRDRAAEGEPSPSTHSAGGDRNGRQAIVETGRWLARRSRSPKPRVPRSSSAPSTSARGRPRRPELTGRRSLYARSKVTFDCRAGLRGQPRRRAHLDFEDTAGPEEQRACPAARSASAARPASTPRNWRRSTPSSHRARRDRVGPERGRRLEGQSEGCLAVNGTMVDRPVVERARRVLREAGR